MPSAKERPKREWLAEQYLLPPEGNGRSTIDIGKELGVTKVTISNWLIDYQLRQDTTERLRYYRRLHAKPRIVRPEKDILAKLYRMPPNGEGMNQDQMAEQLGVSRPTVKKWLKDCDLLEAHFNRHSQRMRGENNPAYTEGNSNNYQRNLLFKYAGEEKVCKWCGATKSIQVHHIDHDRENNVIENLMPLCQHCNIIEAHLWALEEDGRVVVEWLPNPRTITIRFVLKEDKYG